MLYVFFYSTTFLIYVIVFCFSEMYDFFPLPLKLFTEMSCGGSLENCIWNILSNTVGDSLLGRIYNYENFLELVQQRGMMKHIHLAGEFM